MMKIVCSMKNVYEQQTSLSTCFPLLPAAIIPPSCVHSYSRSVIQLNFSSNIAIHVREGHGRYKSQPWGKDNVVDIRNEFLKFSQRV